MTDDKSKTQTDPKTGLAPDAKNQAEVRERADKSGIYTKSDADRGKTGPGGTGASGASGTTGPKLGDGNLQTEATTGTSAPAK